MTTPRYTFLPWLRRGAARAISTPLASATSGRAELPLSLALNQRPIEVPLALYGPGDVTAIDARVVRRLDPPRGTLEAEPYLFAAVELSLPDLPWLLTPGAPEGGRLVPWIALVVVRADRSEIVAADQGPARLELANAAGELPDPAEAWAWAHVQLVGDLDRPLDDIAATQPERLSARLVSPRKLDPGVAWRACVVPLFAAGRAAGLGEAPPAHPLGPAWDAQATGGVTLPVYLHWEFSTARDADFETLVRRLVASAAPEQVGRLPVDVGDPGFGVRGISAALSIEGAMRREGAEVAPLPAEAQGTVEDLERALGEGADPRVVTAPTYGAAAGAPLPADGWLRELNLDPRLRAIAGLGAEVVRRNDEPLVASAWAQLGEAREANRLLGWLTLARQVSTKLYRKHLARLSTDSLISLTAPAHARVRLDPAAPTTARVALRAHLAIPSATTPLFRRATRATGILARRRELLHAIPLRVDGLVTLDRVFSVLGRPAALQRMQLGRLTDEAIAATPRRDRFWIVDEGGHSHREPLTPFPPSIPTDDATFRAAARAHLARLEQMVALGAKPRRKRTVVAVDRAQLFTALDPASRFVALAEAIVSPPPDAPPRAALDPITGAPSFPQPTIHALTALSPAYVLPGLEHVAANSTTLLAQNQRFVEAFLVGMNHEMARELAWREFPSRRGATFFRRFWDVRGRVGGAGEADIAEIASWSTSSALGSHGTAPAATVLVVRGDLVRRFPGVIVYAIPATAGGSPDFAGAEVHALFRGGLDPDVLFAAFPFGRDEARRRWFVLQAQPTAPRFGLDADSKIPVAALQRRNDLSWTHMPAGATHARIAGPLVGRTLRDDDPDADATTPAETVPWGRTAADVAWATLQLPVRVALRGSEMIR